MKHTRIGSTGLRILAMIATAESPPSIRELADTLELHYSGVHAHLHRLLSYGLIKGELKRARTLRPNFTMEIYDQ